MEVRTIFFNGPKGHRWVTAPVPSIEYPSAQPSSPQTDACAQDRRRFFGFLNAMCSRLERHGVTPRRCAEVLRKDIRRRADVPLLTARVGDCRGRSARDA